MSLLDAIKGERKLTLDHWRYRLLHWCFYEKDVKKVSDSSLPRYLYTHYCPLFHLTNLIAVCLPLIVLVRATVATVGGGIAAAKYIARGINSISFKGEPRPLTEAELRSLEIDELVNLLRTSPTLRRDFEYFWMYAQRELNFKYLTREECEERFDRICKKLDEQEEIAARRRAQREAFMVKLVHIGEVVVKNGLRVCGVGALAAAGYGLVQAAPPVWEFLCWFPGATWEFLCWLPWADIGYYTGIAVVGSATAISVGIGLKKASPTLEAGMERLGGFAYDFFVGISPPFIMCGKGIAMPVCWGAAGVHKGIEFVKVFYENNCPPITIIDEDGETEEPMLAAAGTSSGGPV